MSFGVSAVNTSTGPPGPGEMLGVPVVGKVKLRKETLVMVYVCEITNMPFLVTLAKVRESL